MTPIFLSRPNPFTYEQDFFLEKLISYLNNNGLKNCTLTSKDYNPYDSLTCLNEIIKRCYGMIIVAFGQVYMEKGISKKGAIRDDKFFASLENPMDNTWITSPFCHIEGALGFNHGLPLITIKQEDIKIDGILKKDSHIITGPSFSLNSYKKIEQYFKSNEFIKSFNIWKQRIDEFYNFINNNTY